MIDPMPGSAFNRPPMTLRKEGTTLTSRSTRMMRSARSTANAPVVGMSAIPTTIKSKILQGLLKKESL